MTERVEFWPRLGALAVDLTAVLLLAFLFGPWVGVRLGLASYHGMGPGAGGLMAGAAGGSLVLGLLYFAGEAFTGVTPGKWALGLGVGTEDGHEAPRPVYALRWCLKHAGPLAGLLATLVSLATPHVGGFLMLLANLVGLIAVGGFLSAAGPRRQGLHDRIAHTAVYRRAALQPRRVDGSEMEPPADA